jgi:hypothetical protein
LGLLGEVRAQRPAQPHVEEAGIAIDREAAVVCPCGKKTATSRQQDMILAFISGQQKLVEVQSRFYED